MDVRLPIVDLASGPTPAAAGTLEAACREHGFFYLVGHGVDGDLRAELEAASRRFFALPLAEKVEIRMARAGRAWRGYFAVGEELTSGRPDQKEGLYFGAELPAEHPAVRAGRPLHGPNLFPERPAELRRLVLDYLDALTGVGHRLLEVVAVSLGLDPGAFAAATTRDPLILFRIFHYPALAQPALEDGLWSVGEHTDYGLLTILAQDSSGGLQVKGPGGWIDAVPLEDAFVCNIGDMLERMTGGRYHSTPHRVRNLSGRDRLSMPFFFDPGFDAVVEPIPGVGVGRDDRGERWDGADLHAFEGTYGDYLLRKVGKVFPDLAASGDP